MTAKPRQKDVRIPLSFTDAVRGLIKFDPKQLKKRMAKKKAKPQAVPKQKAQK